MFYIIKLYKNRRCFLVISIQKQFALCGYKAFFHTLDDMGCLGSALKFCRNNFILLHYFLETEHLERSCIKVVNAFQIVQSGIALCLLPLNVLILNLTRGHSV